MYNASCDFRENLYLLNNVVTHWSQSQHPSHVIAHGTTAEFHDATTDQGNCVNEYITTDEYHPIDTKRRALSTFTPPNDSISKHRRPILYTRSIDRREMMRRNRLTAHAQITDPQFSNSFHNDLYPEEVFNRSSDRFGKITDQQHCEGTLSRSYLAARSRSGQPSHRKHISYSMSPNFEERNSVFRNKCANEDTWLV